MDDFRQFVIAWLGRRGWNQARLSEAIEINQSLVSKHLTDDPKRRVRPSPENLEKYAPVLGVSYEDLLRMCGYLPGKAGASTGDDIENDIRARTAELLNAVHGAPKAFWPTIIKATYDRAIDGAKDMVELLTAAEDQLTEDRSVPGPEDRAPGRGRIGGSKGRHPRIKPRQQPVLVGA
jgi:transcriptional regulator with XRE-family HTH domain